METDPRSSPLSTERPRRCWLSPDRREFCGQEYLTKREDAQSPLFRAAMKSLGSGMTTVHLIRIVSKPIGETNKRQTTPSPLSRAATTSPALLKSAAARSHTQLRYTKRPRCLRHCSKWEQQTRSLLVLISVASKLRFLESRATTHEFVDITQTGGSDTAAHTRRLQSSRKLELRGKATRRHTAHLRSPGSGHDVVGTAQIGSGKKCPATPSPLSRVQSGYDVVDNPQIRRQDCTAAHLISQSSRSCCPCPCCLCDRSGEDGRPSAENLEVQPWSRGYDDSHVTLKSRVRLYPGPVVLVVL